MKQKAFKSLYGRGFQITFDNQVTLSTCFGWTSRCENNECSDEEPFYKTDWESKDAEVLIKKGDEFITHQYTKRNQLFIENVGFREWLKIFDWCRNYKTKKNLTQTKRTK